MIPPTPEWIILTLISSFLSFSRLALIASNEPWTSALIITGRFFNSPSAILALNSSIVTFVDLLNSFWRRYSYFFCAYSRASLSLFTLISVSPASGTSLRPINTPHSPGLIAFKLRPLSSLKALTLPYATPATMVSPTFNVPFSTITVATGPRPFCNELSIIVALASLFGLAFSSKISACKSTISNKSSIPIPVFADTGTNS